MYFAVPHSDVYTIFNPGLKKINCLDLVQQNQTDGCQMFLSLEALGTQEKHQQKKSCSPNPHILLTEKKIYNFIKRG